MISFQEATQLLKQEAVVALPTETVYGLAVKYNSQKGIEALYDLKGRPKQKPLTINLYSADDIRQFIAYEPEGLQLLMKRYWPGPLTLVVEVKQETILPIVRSGDKTCGFRVPDHTLTREIIKEVGPIVLPSANLSGNMPAKEATQIKVEFKDKVPVLDGGVCKIGIASTVLAFIEGRWQILREGVISRENLKAILGYEPCIILSSQGEK